MSSGNVQEPDLVVVSALFGHGTTYYTHYLNHTGHVARHEHVYGPGSKEPVPGQTHEVSAWSLPHRTDVLLVRDPRKALHTLATHKPHYHEWTKRHLGYHPHTMTLLQRSWVEWYTKALDRDPEILRIEDVPVVPELRSNATRRGFKRPLLWMELSEELRELAEHLGYQQD